MTLSGKHAVVTGGVSGIGRAIADALIHHGAAVSAGARRIPEIDGVPPSDLFRATLDIRDGDSVSAFVSAAISKSGPVDILVNAAGISRRARIAEHAEDVWSDTIETNLTGAFRMIRALLPGMTARGWGRIINIGSTAATAGHVEYGAYCASKAGLLGLTRCVALEGAADGITCNMLSPGWVLTPMMQTTLARVVAEEGRGRTVDEAVAEIAAGNPSGRLVAPEELASHVLHLCSDAAGSTTMQDIIVSGGSTW